MAWTKWTNLGGSFLGAPSAWTIGGVTHVVVRGTDGRVLTCTSSDGETFTALQPLPDGVISSSPTLCAVSSTELRVAARGADGGAWVARFRGGAWQGFARVGGPVLGDVAMTVTRQRTSLVTAPSRTQTVVHYFAWSADKRVMWARDGGVTGGAPTFEVIGGDIELAAPPSAYTLDDGTIVLVGTSPSGAVWARTYAASAAWGSWQLIYKAASSTAVRARRIDGRVTLTGVSLNGVARFWEDAQLREVADTVGATQVSATPCLDSRGAGMRHLVARSTAGSLLHCRSEGDPLTGLVVVVAPPVLPMPGGI